MRCTCTSRLPAPPNPPRTTSDKHVARAEVSQKLQVRGLPPSCTGASRPASPPDPTSPCGHLMIVASVSSVFGSTRTLTAKSSASPDSLSPHRRVTVPSPNAKTHQHKPPGRSLPHNQQCALTDITGPSTSPAIPTRQPLLPGRGVQGEGGAGAGEEPGVPELHFTLMHLQGGGKEGLRGAQPGTQGLRTQPGTGALAPEQSIRWGGGG